MPTNKHTGFTLIEGMITLLVISFGFLAVTRLQISIWNNHLDSSQHREATELGFEKLAAQRQSASVSLIIQPGGSDTTTAALTRYTRSWKINPLSNAGQQHQVQITWGPKSDQHSQLLKTVLGRNSKLADGEWISGFD